MSEYRGEAKVRVLGPGVSGDDLRVRRRERRFGKHGGSKRAAMLAERVNRRDERLIALGGEQAKLAAKRIKKRARTKRSDIALGKVTKAQWLAMDTIWYRKEKNGCHEWLKFKSKGYGKVADNGKQKSAHRVAYELFRGPIPSDLVIDHFCRNRSCVNPAHMQLTTSVFNVMIGESPAARNLGAKACPNGHEYTPENTYVNPATGWRKCRACAKASMEIRQKRLNAAVHK